LWEKVAAKPADEGSKALSAANADAGRTILRDPSSDPAPQGHLLPQGEKGATGGFYKSLIEITIFETCASPNAKTGMSGS
jgi:hypothetical protein